MSVSNWDEFKVSERVRAEEQNGEGLWETTWFLYMLEQPSVHRGFNRIKMASDVYV